MVSEERIAALELALSTIRAELVIMRTRLTSDPTDGLDATYLHRALSNMIDALTTANSDPPAIPD